MDDETLLLAAVLANPDETVPRHMLADLLAERGRSAEAELWLRPPHRHSPFASLIGRTVTAVKFDGDSVLTVYTDSGPLTYSAQGDCCSTSWFYRVLGADNLIGQRVAAVAEGRTSDVDPDDGLGRQESESIYGYCVLTAKGGCEITFRNSSNGYYGGWLEVGECEMANPAGALDITESWVHPPAMACAAAGARYGCKCVTCLIPGGDS